MCGVSDRVKTTVLGGALLLKCVSMRRYTKRADSFPPVFKCIFLRFGTLPDFGEEPPCSAARRGDSDEVRPNVHYHRPPILPGSESAMPGLRVFKVRWSNPAGPLFIPAAKCGVKSGVKTGVKTE